MTQEEADKIIAMFDQQIKVLKELQWYNNLLLWFLYGMIFGVVVGFVIKFFC